MVIEAGDRRHFRRDAAVAYDTMAPFYDAFTSHHNYELWLDNVLPKLEEHGLSGERLLDVACGTGKAVLPMLSRGWRVSGCDISSGMIEIARERLPDNVPLRVADMRKLPPLGDFDLVWALGEAINYLLSTDELLAAFGGMRANLAPGGMVVFDTNAIHAYRTFFAEEEAIEQQGRRLIWRGQTPRDAPPSVLAEASFEVEDLNRSGSGTEPAIHRERHFTSVEVQEALGEAELRLLAVYGYHHDAVLHQPLAEERDTKALYIAAADL